MNMNTGAQQIFQIPILNQHRKTVEDIVGMIKIQNNVMIIEFYKGFEPTLAKMQDLFGCLAGHISEKIIRPPETEERIKRFTVISWGYK